MIIWNIYYLKKSQTKTYVRGYIYTDKKIFKDKINQENAREIYEILINFRK